MPGPLPDQHAKILAQKLADGQLAVFVGAGLSRQAIARDGSGRRLPLWKELAEQVAVACHEDLDGYGGNILDLFDAIELGQSRFILEEAVRAALDDEAYDPSAAHEALVELPWAAVYTTNYDGLLGQVLKADPVFEEEQYDRLQLPADKRPRLFHVHGTLAKPHTLRREDYRLWPEKHPRAFRDLEQVILNKTVLFVGYSLSDPHLADGILPTVRKITAGREKRLYAWMWNMPPNQVQLLDRRDKIEAIPIERDEDWAAAFRQVADALGEVRRAPGAAVGAAAADPFAYDRQQYLAAVEARHGIANLQGLYVSGAGYARGDVLLSEVFVEPDLVVIPTVPGTALGHDRLADASATIADAFEFAIAAAVSKAAAGRARSDALSTALKKRAEEEGETTTRRERSSQVMARDARLLIVGAPGEGKSTLLRHDLLQAAARWRERPTEHPFPIFVRLADWEAEVGASDGRLFRFLGNRLPAMGEIGSKAVEQWLRGPVLWLLDGIDEIRDAGERVRLVEEVKATSAVRIHDRWIVSTRPAGEPRGGLSAGWTRAVLPNLSDAQVEGVLARWGSVLEAKERLVLDARQMARDLRKDPGLRQVRTNALLLTLAILFFKIRKRLPHDRWEFYDAAEKALRDSWVNYRIRSAERYLPGDYLPDLLERLALSGMENGHVLFPRETLKTATRAVLAERGYTGGEQSEEIGRFLRAAEDLIGVLIEQGPDRFGFLHLTFQEFYAARAVVHRNEGERTRLIARYWDHPDWREVWPLYALGVQSDAAKLDHLFQTILNGGDDLDAQLFRPQLACLRLAGLGSAPHPPAIGPVLHWAFNILKKATYPVLEVLAGLGLWERRLTDDLRSAVLARLDDGDWEVLRAAPQALASVVSEEDVLASLLSRLGNPGVNEVLWGTVNQTAVRAAVLARLADDEGDVRRAAARALAGAVGEAEVRAALLVRLEDERWDVRNATAWALWALADAAGDPAVRSALLARFCDNRAPGDRGVLGVIGAPPSAAREPEVRAALLAWLGNDDCLVREAAVRALADVADEPDVQAALLARLEDWHPSVRGAALKPLAHLVAATTVRSALLALLARLGDEDPHMRSDVARALENAVGTLEVREALLARLNDEHSRVRAAAAQALAGAVGELEVRTALLSRLQDNDMEVRRASIKALEGAVEETEVRAGLLAKIDDEEGLVRKSALWALVGAANDALVRTSASVDAQAVDMTGKSENVQARSAYISFS